MGHTYHMAMDNGIKEFGNAGVYVEQREKKIHTIEGFPSLYNQVRCPGEATTHPLNTLY